MFKRRVYKCHNLSDPRGYFRMVRSLIKELITEEMLELIQLTQGFDELCDAKILRGL